MSTENDDAAIEVKKGEGEGEGNDRAAQLAQGGFGAIKGILGFFDVETDKLDDLADLAENFPMPESGVVDLEDLPMMWWALFPLLIL